MKGIVFTELIEMVEKDLGFEIADRMISNSNTPNAGAYTTVGTYDHRELIELVVSLSGESGIPVAELVRIFGKHLFQTFVRLYPGFFERVETALDFLPSIETYIHVEVRKLYPDAELPTFQSERTESGLTLTYQSKRPFADLAEGLILAAIDHFGDTLSLRRIDLDKQDGTAARFELIEKSQSALTEGIHA
ncbi:MAG: heme NO-binding domain-containing protein [Pirellulaceae bacterium]